MGNFVIKVECYSGYCGEESPQRFYLREKVIDISEILDRWLSPEHRYFKVRGGDGAIYILRHDSGSGEWELALFDSGKREDTRLSST
jgi:hypothetical protein